MSAEERKTAWRFGGRDPEEDVEGEERFTPARVAAVTAVVVAGVVAAILLFGGDSYRVTAEFLNAGQLVKGNPVQSAGNSIGTVKKIRITDDGHAAVTLAIDGDHSPLPQGTRASIRQFSLSGLANRYVDLSFPTGRAPPIADGGHIGVDRTTTSVDLDQLFNTLDPRTRKSLQGFFKGGARQFAGKGRIANAGLHYLDPALSTSSRLFSELTRDTPVLQRFLLDSAKLVTTLADRRDHLATLVGNLNDTTRALGNQKSALAESISRLPPFMRRANTTFVNLRSALGDVDPLVDASKPVARLLGPFLAETRRFAADARPTVRDLSRTIRRRGAGNDLIELVSSVPPLEEAALVTKRRTVAPGGRRVSVGLTRGAFPETADALAAAAPEIALARPYTTDFLGWLDDFSNTGGGFDALGTLARAHLNFAENLPLAPGLGPVRRGQFKRCPGGSEAPADDGSNVLSADERRALQCEESARAVTR